MKKTILTLWLSVSLMLHAQAQQYGLLRTIGADGTADGKFHNPRSIATDAAYNVYVVDMGNNRIQKFDSAGNFLLKWGGYGAGDGQFNTPAILSVDEAGFVYVTDPGNYRVQKFDGSGNFICKWGSSGSLPPQFKGLPIGIAAKNGFAYVIDYSGDTMRVKKFTNVGLYVLQWKMPVGEVSPEGMAIDLAGNLCLLTAAGGVRKYSPTGVLISSWTDPNLISPWSISIDAADNIFITEESHPNYTSRFLKYTPLGVLDTLSEWAIGINADFTSVSSSVNGYVYVCESNSSDIRVYSTGVPYTPPTTIATGITGSGAPETIGLFPNPSASEVSLFVNDQSGTIKVSIYSATGSIVYENNSVPSNENFTLPNFASGIYAVVVTGSKGIATKKLVKI